MFMHQPSCYRFVHSHLIITRYRMLLTMGRSSGRVSSSEYAWHSQSDERCEGPDLGCPVQVTTDQARLRCEAPQDSNHITHSTSHIGNKTIAWPQTVIITIYLDYLCKYFVTPKQIVVDLTNIICLSTLSYCSCEVELKVLYISCVTVSFGPDHFIIVN